MKNSWVWLTLQSLTMFWKSPARLLISASSSMLSVWRGRTDWSLLGLRVVTVTAGRRPPPAPGSSHGRIWKINFKLSFAENSSDSVCFGSGIYQSDVRMSRRLIVLRTGITKQYICSVTLSIISRSRHGIDHPIRKLRIGCRFFRPLNCWWADYHSLLMSSCHYYSAGHVLRKVDWHSDNISSPGSFSPLIPFLWPSCVSWSIKKEVNCLSLLQH